MKGFVKKAIIIAISLFIPISPPLFYYVGAGYENGALNELGVPHGLFTESSFNLVLTGFQASMDLSFHPVLYAYMVLVVVLIAVIAVFPVLIAFAIYVWKRSKSSGLARASIEYEKDSFMDIFSNISVLSEKKLALPIYLLMLFVVLILVFFASSKILWERSGEQGADFYKTKIDELLLKTVDDELEVDDRNIAGGVLRCSESHCVILEIKSRDPQSLEVLTLPVAAIKSISRQYTTDQKDKTTTEKP